jgi:Lhr-like helicase
VTPAFDRLTPALRHQIVHALGFSGLRPVQALTTDAILDGDNCVVLAPTAGGKTEAAFFPLLSAMDAHQWGPPSVLYLSPIKALLNNQHARLERLAGLLSPLGEGPDIAAGRTAHRPDRRRGQRAGRGRGQAALRRDRRLHPACGDALPGR